MFSFTDISKIDERGIQLIMREVPNDRLLLGDEKLARGAREKLYSAMSERAAEMLREDSERPSGRRRSPMSKRLRETSSK